MIVAPHRTFIHDELIELSARRLLRRSSRQSNTPSHPFEVDALGAGAGCAAGCAATGAATNAAVKFADPKPLFKACCKLAVLTLSWKVTWVGP